jgi:hypothetical protein
MAFSGTLYAGYRKSDCPLRRFKTTFSLLRIWKYGASEKFVLNLLKISLGNKKSHRKERKKIRNEVFEGRHGIGFSQRPDRSMGFAEKLMVRPV